MADDDVKTFIANLQYAIQNNEKVSIGGGLFDRHELQAVWNALQPAPKSVAHAAHQPSEVFAHATKLVTASLHQRTPTPGENDVVPLERRQAERRAAPDLHNRFVAAMLRHYPLFPLTLGVGGEYISAGTQHMWNGFNLVHKDPK